MSDQPSSKEKFIVRLPDGLRDRIRAAAEERGHSMNSEIVSTLEEKYPTPIDGVSDPAAKTLLWMAERIRSRSPKPGSLRDKQAATYERLAKDINARLGDQSGMGFDVVIQSSDLSISNQQD